MKTLHTPGPWHGARHHSEWLICDGHQLIATTAGSPPHLGHAHAKRDEANARLIVAAPDLLEALLKYSLPIDTNNLALSRSEFGSEAVDRELCRRAAILKATGSPQ